MANIEHIRQIDKGVKVWNAWRKANPAIVPDLKDLIAPLSSTLYNVDLNGADLSGADLSHSSISETNLSDADLTGADLTGADLFNANLRGANLRGAELLSADLRSADLSGADLNGASLFRANLCDANLVKANLSNADLSQASLISSCLDGANLTDAQLWDIQWSGWSIKGVTCERAFWDRHRDEATEYEDGAFERIFAEKLRIVLRYAGGMSPIDLAMLPLIIERLQVKHPDSSLHIRSVQDDGSGATVTITVEDLADRSDEAFAQAVEVMRGDLSVLQQRLRQEEHLRLAFETKYYAVVHDILPMMMERALSKTEVNIGHLTASMTIEGITMSGDTNINKGQAGVIGRNAHAHDMTFQQVQNQSSIDFPRLAEELAKLHAAMKQETQGTREQDKAIVAVADAEEAASKGDGPTTLQHLKAVGKWTLGIAEKISVSVATEAIKRAMSP